MRSHSNGDNPDGQGQEPHPYRDRDVDGVGDGQSFPAGDSEGGFWNGNGPAEWPRQKTLGSGDGPRGRV